MPASNPGEYLYSVPQAQELCRNSQHVGSKKESGEKKVEHQKIVNKKYITCRGDSIVVLQKTYGRAHDGEVVKHTH